METFAARINSAFYPQPQGARATITVEQDYPAAFSAFRAIHKRTGRNVAAFAGDYHAAMWAAIRAGWRAGYTVATGISGGIPEAAYSRYGVAVPPTEAGVKAAEEAHEQIRRSRAALKIARAFDFEVGFDSAVSPDALRTRWSVCAKGAHAPQLVGGTGCDDLDEMAAIARQFQITLTFGRSGTDDRFLSPVNLSSIARATAGRVDFHVKDAAEAEFVAENLFS